MAKKDYRVKIHTGRAYLKQGEDLIRAKFGDPRAELMALEAKRDILDQTERLLNSALCVEELEAPKPLTIETLKAARDLIADIPKPTVDEIKCLRPLDLEELYPDNFRTSRGRSNEPAEHFLFGVPVKSHWAIPPNLAAFFLNEELVGVSKIKKEL